MPINIKAYGAVSVRDYTDLGQILVYLTSSQPSTVVYNPNQNSTSYVPDWSTNNLVITPVIQYNGASLPLNSSGLTITYTRKEGSGNASALTTGEAVSGGILTVSANKLASVSSGQLTYICTVSYTDPEVGVPVETQASMTYTLITQATEPKSASITGESLFLYNSDKVLVGNNTIVLTADVSNVEISQWQYQKSDGTYAAFPTTYNTSISGDTLNVKATEANIWLNSRTAVIKLATTDADVYDIHQITKVEDGARGNATVSAVLSNENHYVPCSATGTVLSWNGASTKITIYEGGTDTTSSWNINVTLGNGLSGTFDSTTSTFTPDGLTEETSYCDFVCTRTDYATITRRFTITKTRSGADGNDAEIYMLEADTLTININESGVFSPTSVTFSGWKRVGNSTTATAYAGRFKIEESTDGSTYPASAAYTSNSNESTKTWTPSSTNVKMIRCTLYASGGTSNALDTQTIIITHDGISGKDGDDGLNGISMGLGNYQDVLPCSSNGYTSQAKDISIPFYGLAGITKVPVTATVGTLPGGITVKSNTAGTASSNGLLILTVANNSALGDASLITGDITITLACTYNSQTQSAQMKYTWTKNLKAVNGKDAVVLQVYSEDGAVLHNSSGTTTLQVRLISGASTVTPAKIQWQQYSSGDYSDISGKTSASLVVTPSMVTDYAFFKVKAWYPTTSDGPYEGYITVDDETDPYVAYTFATVPEFKNSQGFGAIYTRVYQNGIEVDPIKSTTFSDTAPTSPSTGDYYYHLDSSNQTCTLKKYNGTRWVDATSDDNDKFTYNYYRQNAQGTPLDTTQPYADTRCFYIDPSIINGRMQFICEVS